MILLLSLAPAIGVAASILTATSLLPQLIKIVREKKAGDISMMMLLTLFTGLGLWVWYGFLIEDWIICISNAFSFLINLGILIFTIRYK